MASTNPEFKHLSYVLLWRGGAMLALGLAAVVWPEAILIPAMLAVGLVATLLGLYEMSVAFAIRRRSSQWRLMLAHGVLSIAFGGLSVGVPGVSLQVALLVIATWFALYAGIAYRAAAIAWPLRTARWTLIAWGSLDVGVAIVAVVYPAATIFALLFFGAVYAALFGAWQLAAGLWIRRALGPRGAVRPERRFVPAPS